MNRFAYRYLFYVGFALTILAYLCFYSCQQHQNSTIAWMDGLEVATDTIACQEVFHDSGSDELFVKEDIDLNGKRCSLPKGVTINFQGGVIKNGTLIGDETRIECTGVCFDRVRILGTWDVPDISTAMFCDLDYDNSLKDVVALANAKVNNRIVIEKGDYQVSALPTDPVCLRIYGNTEFILDGTIRLVPNEYSHYYILQVEGENIEIEGHGLIIGDKHTHTGTTGEWGIGIRLSPTHHVSVSGLSIKDCWGDCIYVGEKSTDVLIENCHLDHGRRQGISITSANGVTIRDCEISNVGGTNPEYGIDVEPNAGDLVDDVMIEKVTVRDCKGGFSVYGYAENARVGKVCINDSEVSAFKKAVITARKCDTVIVENCDIKQRSGWWTIEYADVSYGVLRNNTLHYDKGLVSLTKNLARQVMGKKKMKVLDITNCKTVSIEQNKGME